VSTSASFLTRGGISTFPVDISQISRKLSQYSDVVVTMIIIGKMVIIMMMPMIVIAGSLPGMLDFQLISIFEETFIFLLMLR
jgi:hypothetical protein